MSDWIEITDPDCVELSDEGDEVFILYDTNDFGNCYVTVPVKVIFNLFTEEQLAAIIGEIEAKRGLESHAPSPEAD